MFIITKTGKVSTQIIQVSAMQGGKNAKKGQKDPGEKKLNSEH